MRLGVEAALVDGRLVPGDLEIVDGHIGRHGLASRNGHGIASPGFVDIQVNGFGGVDFLDADSDGYQRAGEALLETGVTAYLPPSSPRPKSSFTQHFERSLSTPTAAHASSVSTWKGRFSPRSASARILPWRAETPIRPCSSACSTRVGSEW